MTYKIQTICSLITAASFSFCADASAADSAGLRKIIKARSSSQLARILSDDQKMRRSRLVCDAELRSRRIPEACFEALSLTKVHKDFAWHGENDDGKDEKWLEELCVSRAEGSHDWKELQRASLSPRLASRCREAVLRRRDDLTYADQSERPAEVFGRHVLAE